MMKNPQKTLILASLLGLFLSGFAGAAEILVSADIAVDTVWTANNTYNLQDQVYVLPGASLTIQAGTLIASTPTINGSGSLAVCAGAKIYILGTESNPVIMTSTNDDLVTWREACNEWGNLTLMGNALTGCSHYMGSPIPGNTKTPTGLNTTVMEGLAESFPGDTRIVYGGADDDDDSGTINYLSLRYGGRVLGLTDELNGISIGGVGRGTDISHLEIMNNVDDGIEIWGGTVNIKYFSVWNIGDDSFDVDQGWRGKAQFGLIVQGHSVDAARGSGVCDNVFEIDGSEDSDAQPVTTAAIYNVTAIGQPLAGRRGTDWRDNARVQFRNCIFMDLGHALVHNSNSDGHHSGYGFNGTLSFANTWATDYDHSHNWAATINRMEPQPAPGAFNHPAMMYQAQTSGKLSEITDSVFFRNLNAAAYTTSDAVGVTVSGGSNPAKHNVVATDMPIQSLTRGAPVTKGSLTLLPVLHVNPLPANDALVSNAAAPNDGFFTPAMYRGAFAPGGPNWLEGWSAAFNYGMTGELSNVEDWQLY